MANLGRKLINDPLNVVTEFIEGLVETYPGLQHLNGFPQVKVVLRADFPRSRYDKVAIISGGGSGHEPADAGFVGEGMLTAAICGDIFSSPSVDAILAGIRAVTGPKGCLLIVKNYSSDRLNFGLAAEEAKSEGYKIETVIVGDDCAMLPPRGILGRRGLAGTILVQKVAGAAAAAGLSLTSVATEARSVAEKLGTMTVALSGCRLPGQLIPDLLPYGKMELGLGMQGEPGWGAVDIQTVDVVVPRLLQHILSSETNFTAIKPGSRVAVLINGLGATPIMELMIAAGKVVPNLQLNHGLAVARVYTGSLMTSLDMTGLSISLMKVDSAILLRLDAPTTAPAWPVGVNGPRPHGKIPIPMPQAPLVEKSSGRPLQLNEQDLTLEAAIEAAANAIIGMRASLNEWDRNVGDGDCGSIMCEGAKAILDDIKNYPLNDAAETVNEIAASLGRVMGGRSGIIYAILCKAAYAELRSCKESAISSKEWAQALASSVAAVSKYGGAIAGYRTLLDALIPASSVLQKKLDGGVDPCTAFVASSEAALEGAESTREMHPGIGVYIPSEILRSNPDPGAMAAASWYRAAALAVKERNGGLHSLRLHLPDP